ncbi:MAG: secondary thiamine-phosphate synthase enzyme YjbQ [Candidatus Competibacteraceae bacterium]|jgi:secondary thiamine-phosphate synthase enzyme|nr:secondary thiamine-phosphate synthase enzyme YjbQ [Candidatus Competibacteraceae bacterium]
MIAQHTLTLRTQGRGTYNVTEQVQAIVRESGVLIGVAHIFVHHTSASLILCENADPTVREDLETFMARLIPDGAPWFEHVDEGPDDMPAHMRTVLTQSNLTIPISQGRCGLGIWQGVYLWEHRTMDHTRRLTVTVQGE